MFHNQVWVFGYAPGSGDGSESESESGGWDLVGVYVYETSADKRSG